MLQARPLYKMLALVLSGLVIGSVASFTIVEKICELGLGTSIWIDTSKVSPGYTLVAPYYGDNDFDEPGEVHLIDNTGDAVHTWYTRYPTLISYLQPNGHLFAAMTPPINIADFPSGGSTGLIQELDWEGNVLWEYEDRQMTHDFEVLPNGNIVYTRWSLAPKRFAESVRGGMQLPTTMVWTNELVEVNRDKKIVWTWRPEDHLDPHRYVLGPLTPRNDWAHINSVRYTLDNPITHTPAYLISARNISTLFIIDAKTGAVIWETKRILSLQHDATFTDAGNVLVFDNGFLRDIPRPLLVSGVGEVDPRTNEILWTYSGGSSTLEKAQFTSSIMGGAQRLPNGNTLITASMANTVLEVTEEGSVAWKFTNDFRDSKGRMHVTFKVRKYDSTGTMWEPMLSKQWDVSDVLCHFE